MPLFQTITNTTLARLVSNSGEELPISLNGGKCIVPDLWTERNTHSRVFWEQAATNTALLRLVFDVQLPSGVRVNTVRIRVRGQSYGTHPTLLPRGQFLAMDARVSEVNTSWTILYDEVDTSSTVGEYNQYHEIVLSPATVIQSYYRYAVSVVADQSSTARMLLEGIRLNYSFTES